MRQAVDLLSQYARYHRDRRNIVSHFVGVPLIVFGIGALLSRPELARAGTVDITLGWIAFAMATLWYLTRGSAVLGLATSASVGALLWLAHQTHGASTSAWLGWGLGMFVIGWLIQFVGHWYEGRKPAFVDDIVGLLVGPMFVTAEALFMLGWNKPMLAEVERRAGPTCLRDLARIA